MVVNVGSAVGYLDLDISAFKSGLQNAQQQAQSSFSSIVADAGARVQQLGGSMSQLGQTMSVAITAPLVGLAGFGMKIAADFDKAMAEVKAITGATGDEFVKLKELALELGASTAFSASEVATAMTEMGKAGWDNEQIIRGIAGVLDGAAASGIELARAAEVVAGTLLAFNESAEKSTHLSDMLTQAANTTTTGFSELGSALEKVAPAASRLGLDMEETVVALTAMANSSQSAELAGNALNAMFNSLLAPTSDAQKVMDELGLSFFDAKGQFVGVEETVARLREALVGLSQEEQSRVLSQLGTADSARAISALIKMNAEDYDALKISIIEADGAAAAAAATMQDNLSSAFEQLGGALETLSIKFVDGLMPVIRPIISFVTQLVEALANLPAPVKVVIVALAALAAAIGPMLAIGGGLIAVIGGIVAALPVVIAGLAAVAPFLPIIGAAFLAVTAAVTIFVGALTFLGKALYDLWTTNDEFRNAFIEAWTTITAGFSQLGGELLETLYVIAESWGFTAGSMAELWAASLQIISDVTLNALNYIMALFPGFLDWLRGWLPFLEAFFTGDFVAAWDILLEQLTIAFYAIWPVINDALNFILENIVAFFNSAVKPILIDVAKSTADAFIAAFVDKVTLGLASAIKTITTSNAKYAKSIGVRDMADIQASISSQQSSKNGQYTSSGLRVTSADEYAAMYEKQGGNTYNFYSPEPIDEVTARREFERSQRSLAAGF